MPQLQQFTADTLPDHVGWQIHDFVRIHWFDIFAYEKEADVHPAMWHPTYFVVTEQKALYSAATAVWQDITVNGEIYRTHGLSGVLTYPAFRGQGYGRQVVAAATDFIKAQPDADLAILWTGSNLETFYNQSGWENPRDFTVTQGDPSNPEVSEFPMLLYLSNHGRALRESLAGKSLYFGPYNW